jgi:hypothetical protein
MPSLMSREDTLMIGKLNLTEKENVDKYLFQKKESKSLIYAISQKMDDLKP